MYAVQLMDKHSSLWVQWGGQHEDLGMAVIMFRELRWNYQTWCREFGTIRLVYLLPDGRTICIQQDGR